METVFSLPIRCESPGAGGHSSVQMRSASGTLTSSYYRGAQGIILVYDHTVPASFENLKFWLDEVRKSAPGFAHCGRRRDLLSDDLLLHKSRV